MQRPRAGEASHTRRLATSVLNKPTRYDPPLACDTFRARPPCGALRHEALTRGCLPVAGTAGAAALGTLVPGGPLVVRGALGAREPWSWRACHRLAGPMAHAMKTLAALGAGAVVQPTLLPRQGGPRTGPCVNPLARGWSGAAGTLCAEGVRREVKRRRSTHRAWSRVEGSRQGALKAPRRCAHRIATEQRSGQWAHRPSHPTLLCVPTAMTVAVAPEVSRVAHPHQGHPGGPWRAHAPQNEPARIKPRYRVWKVSQRC
jgi:hypothetical protein